MSFLQAYLPNISHLGILGYLFIVAISFAEAFVFTGLIVPGTVVVVIAGGLAAQGIYSFWIVVIAATIGAVLGDGVSYELGRRGKMFLNKRPWLQRQVNRAKPFFQKHQVKSLIVGRFVGWVRPIVPFIAGTMEMPRTRFYIANIIGGILWAVAYVALGYVFGAAWKLALLWGTRVGIFLVVVFVLLSGVAWLWRWMLRHGEEIIVLLFSFGNSIKIRLLKNPKVKKWLENHPSSIQFFRNRFSTRSFFGLPFTLLAFAFVYTVGLLLGIVQDYLSGDPLILVDKRLANLLFAFRYSPLLHFFYFITLFAEAGVVIAVVLILTGILLHKRQRIFAFTLWLTLIGSEGTTYVGKLLFHRLRPDELLRAIAEESFSFPSGHATGAVALYGFVAYLLIRTHRSWKVKVSSFFGALTMILLIDVSRLYLGVHYLSDVLAGNLVGLSALIFSISVTEWLLWQKKEQSPSPSSFPLFIVGVTEICIVVLLFFFAPSPWTPTEKPETERIEVRAVLPLFQKGTLPLFTETLIGERQEPINLIIIAPQKCLIDGFSKVHWMPANTISLSSLKQAVKAIFLNRDYPSAPMTPSFYDTRPHDLSFEKETQQKTLPARHHVRFWQTPYNTASGSLFVGTVSLDMDVKWGSMTHEITPDIDTERHLLISDLRNAGLSASGQETTLVSPMLGKNFSEDGFFTDGKAAFTILNCR